MFLRVYGKIVEGEGAEARYYVTIKTGTGPGAKIPVELDVFELIDDLQREIWRMDKEDSRHCIYVGSLSEDFVPYEQSVRTPEQIVIEKYDRSRLGEALLQIPEKQRRRFLMRYEACLPIKKIAEIEECSDRSIKYSLALAKSNLRDILGDDINDSTFETRS